MTLAALVSLVMSPVLDHWTLLWPPGAVLAWQTAAHPAPLNALAGPSLPPSARPTLPTRALGTLT